PNFNKPLTGLDTLLDQWMYLMKHSHEMNQLANYLDKRIFSRIFAIGELANLTPEEHMAYISSLDRKRDDNNTIAYAKKQGIAVGERKKAIETALEMKKDGFPVEQIAKFTKLSIEEIEKLK